MDFVGKRLHDVRQHKPSSSSASGAPIWVKCEGRDGAWQSGSETVQLSEISLFALTGIEKVYLRRIALEKLRSDKEFKKYVKTDKVEYKYLKQLFKNTSRNALFKRIKLKSEAHSPTSVVNTPPVITDENSVSKIFGVPIGQCLANDILNSRKKEMRKRSVLILYQDENLVKSSNSLNKSILSSEEEANIPTNAPHRRRIMCSSFKTRHNTFTRDIESLTQTCNFIPQIPLVVVKCIKYIELNGIRTEGIFRIAAAKRRLRQLRDLFDSGNEVDMSENSEYSIHDIAALLKEYLRELPEPLLTRYLYTAFIHTCDLRHDTLKHLYYLRMLIYLLPNTHRDTLYILLKFLYLVSRNSGDQVGPDGETMKGNKMTVFNLATLFGPNILRISTSVGPPSKPSSFQIDSAEQVADRMKVIEVTQALIELNAELFKVHTSCLDDLYISMFDRKPDLAAPLLKKRSNRTHHFIPRREIFQQEGAKSSKGCSNRSLRATTPPAISVRTDFDECSGVKKAVKLKREESRGRSHTVNRCVMEQSDLLTLSQEMKNFTQSENVLASSEKKIFLGYPQLLNYNNSYAAKIRLPTCVHMTTMEDLIQIHAQREQRTVAAHWNAFAAAT